MSEGLFVTIEGCEGAGKSTQAVRLAESLKGRGRSVLLTREPGGTPVSERIREILLDPAYSDLSPRVELLLYLASRAQLTDRLIRPALDRGEIVVSDRFHHSTLAYQGGARGLGIDEVDRINRFATGGLMPDVTFLLDLPPEDGFARKAGSAADRLEGEGIEFHRRVREAFLRLAELEPERIVMLDGRRGEDEIAAQIESRVLELLVRTGNP